MLIEDEYSPILFDRTKFLSILGGLSYITNVARPDIAYVTNYLARCSAQPRMYQLKLAKRVLTYLYTTRDRGLKYDRKKQRKNCECMRTAMPTGQVKKLIERVLLAMWCM